MEKRNLSVAMVAAAAGALASSTTLVEPFKATPKVRRVAPPRGYRYLTPEEMAKREEIALWNMGVDMRNRKKAERKAAKKAGLL